MARGTPGTGVGQAEPRKITFKWSTRGTQMQTGFYLRKQVNVGATDQDIALHVQTNLAAAFRGMLSNQSNFLGIDVLNVVTKEGYVLETPNTLGLWETAAGPTLLMATLALKTGVRSRVGQGRMFLPVASLAGVNQDVLFGDGITRLNAFKTAFDSTYVDPTGAGQFSAVTYHPTLPAGRPHKGSTVLPEVPAEWIDVSSTRLNAIVSAVRSRRQGVGA